MIKRNKSRKPKNKVTKPKNKSRKPKKAKGSSHFISVKSFTRRLREKSKRMKEIRIKKARVFKNKKKIQEKIKKIKKKEIQEIQAAIKAELEKEKYPAIDDDNIAIGTMLVSKFNAPIDIILEILKQSKELEEEDKKNKKIRSDKIDKIKNFLIKINEDEEEKFILNDLLPDISSLSNINEIIKKLENLKENLQSTHIDYLIKIDNDIDNIENILDKLYVLLDSFLLDEHPNEETIQQILTSLEEYQQNYD
mgnify:CR=1 FL=1